MPLPLLLSSNMKMLRCSVAMFKVSLSRLIGNRANNSAAFIGLAEQNRQKNSNGGRASAAQYRLRILWHRSLPSVARSNASDRTLSLRFIYVFLVGFTGNNTATPAILLHFYTRVNFLSCCFTTASAPLYLQSSQRISFPDFAIT